MAEPDLLPCPFCGERLEQIVGTKGIYSCPTDGCYTRDIGVDTQSSDDVAAWNRRASTRTPDQTNAEVSDERLREIIDGAKGYIGANGFDPDPEEIIAICAALLNRRSVTSQASEGEGWQQAVEPFLGLLDPIPVVGDHVEIASLKGDVCDKFVDEALSLTVGDFRALRDASPSKRVERLETALTLLRPAGNIAYNLKQTATSEVDRGYFDRISKAIDGAIQALQGGRS